MLTEIVDQLLGYLTLQVAMNEYFDMWELL
jgi:hypothetical protein